MNTLFQHARDTAESLITEIDGRPFIIDTDFARIVPYNSRGAVAWAATKFIERDEPDGLGPLRWHKAMLPTDGRVVAHAALTEAQAVFLARRFHRNYGRAAAIAQIEAAFAAWHALRRAAGSNAQLRSAAPAAPLPAAAPTSDLHEVVAELGREMTALADLRAQRTAIGMQIAAAAGRVSALESKLPPFLRVSLSAATGEAM